MSQFDFGDAPRKPGRRSVERTPFQWGFGIGCGLVASVVAVVLLVVTIMAAVGGGLVALTSK